MPPGFDPALEREAFGSFVALVPAPLCIGTLRLADGRAAKGFRCEPFAVNGAEDIAAFGGWRAWLKRSEGPLQPLAVGPESELH